MMSKLAYFLPWLLAALLTIGSGVVAGAFGNRWGPPAAMSAAAAQLERVPAKFGDWSLQSDEPLDPRLVEMFQCAGSVVRSYRNRRTGDTVHMAIVLGPPGPISVHTPEICYSAQGLHVESLAERISFRVSGEPVAHVWKTIFAPDVPGPEKLLAYYTWFDGESWSAPNHARLAFGGRPFLLKLQLATKIVKLPGTDDQGDPGDDFLAQFYPALHQAGFFATSL